MTTLTVIPDGGPGTSEQFEALYRSCASDLYG
jgi:hypothetical protein